MFDEPSSATSVAALTAQLAGAGPASTDAERIDRIRQLEELRSVVAAAQARETAVFVASQRSAQRAAGVPADRVGRGIAAQVALARRVSPSVARRYVGWSTILTTELPATFAALVSGRTTEWRAMLVARETAWLSREHRAEVDRQLAGRIESLGDKRVEDETRKAAYTLDPHGYLDRIRGAEKDRYVSLRPAPDVMARLGTLLPAAQGVACYAALKSEADTLVGIGDPRGHGQIMADTLVQRLTGQTTAGGVPVEVGLVMTDASLLGEADSMRREEPARLDGYGTVPAGWARDLVFGASVDHDAAKDDSVPVWLRRLYLHPTTGELAAMDSTRRTFTGNQRRFVRLRDERCRTPWCEAPIRHIDHVQPAAEGGPTHVANGQGFCVACNHAKQAPGWRSTRRARDNIVTTTPTGHQYRSRAPALPGAGRDSPIEARLSDLLRRAA